MNAFLVTFVFLVMPYVVSQNAPQDGENREGREGRRGMRGQGGPRGFGGPGGPGGPGRFGGGSEEERQQWRERMEKYRNATPAERANLRMEGMVEMTARNYGLDETEKATVRREMEAMQAERRAAMGPDADEYDRLREKMFEFWNRPREGGNAEGGDRPDWRGMRDNPEFRELQEKIRTLDEKYPFDWQASIARVEKVIPADKVAKGKARMEERRAQWQNRDGNRDRDRERGRDREGRRNRGDRGDRRRRLESGNDSATSNPPPAAAEQPKVEAILKSSKTLHPWEEYVNSFSARYKLDPAQIASAQSVLKDSLARGSKLEQEDAARNSNSGKKSAELTSALDNIFKELKGRLDALLTAEQRTKG